MRRWRRLGSAGAGAAQRPSAPCSGLPHAGGSVWRGPGGGRCFPCDSRRGGGGGAGSAGVAGLIGLPVPSAAFAGGGRFCCVRVAARRLSRAAATAKPGPGRCVSPLGLCCSGHARTPKSTARTPPGAMLRSNSGEKSPPDRCCTSEWKWRNIFLCVMCDIYLDVAFDVKLS